MFASHEEVPLVICRGFDPSAGWFIFYTDRESSCASAIPLKELPFGEPGLTIDFVDLPGIEVRCPEGQHVTHPGPTRYRV